MTTPLGAPVVDRLVTWFLEEFERRTRARGANVYYALPETRVTAHEVLAKAQALGVAEAREGMLFRPWFQVVFERRLRAPCRAILRREGDANPLAPLHGASRAGVREYLAGLSDADRRALDHRVAGDGPFVSKAAMRAAYPEGPPAFYPWGPDGQLATPPFVFCGEEHRAAFLAARPRHGSRDHRAWRFVRGVPRCDHCRRPLWRGGARAEPPSHGQWEVLLALAAPGQSLAALDVAGRLTGCYLPAGPRPQAVPVANHVFQALLTRGWLARLGRPRAVENGARLSRYRLSVRGRRAVERLRGAGPTPLPLAGPADA